MTPHRRKIWALHLGLIGVLLVLNWALPAYHHTNLARIMVLSVFAMGYNIAFGYTGLLSLGHALFFAAAFGNRPIRSQPIALVVNAAVDCRRRSGVCGPGRRCQANSHRPATDHGKETPGRRASTG